MPSGYRFRNLLLLLVPSHTHDYITGIIDVQSASCKYMPLGKATADQTVEGRRRICLVVSGVQCINEVNHIGPGCMCLSALLLEGVIAPYYYYYYF